MGDYIISIFGTILSVIFFLISYRQTIGARKERIKSVNNDLVSILIRRIVLENITPSLDDIARLIEGKARDAKIKSTYLLSEQQIMNTIYSRIYETDFINKEQRNKVINRILPVLIKSEERPISEEVFLSDAIDISKLYKIYPVLLALIASIMGVTTSVLATKDNSLFNSKENIAYFILTILTSFIILIFLIMYRRYKDDSGDENKQSSADQYVDFESEVLKAIKNSGFRSILPRSPNIPYDFIIEKGDKKIIVEAKLWSRRVPNILIKKVVQKLILAVEDEKATEAILVTKYPIQSFEEYELEKIRIFSMKEFKNYLVN